jgi:MazG family protein
MNDPQVPPAPTDTDVPRSGENFHELVAVMRRLLAPDGCPWDREQTLATLVPYLVEETYEVIDALDSGDAREHCEELGDLLLQVVFQAELRRGEGRFDVNDVVEAIRSKLVRRHPHVFGEVRLRDAAEVVANWSEIKAQERKDKAGGGPARALAGVPSALPALLRAARITDKAAAAGFDWPDPAGPRAKVAEELAELDGAMAANDAAAVEHELGDLLLAVVNLARHRKVDAESALRGAVQRFVTRFEHVEDRLAAVGRSPRGATLAELDALWEQAKALARSGG